MVLMKFIYSLETRYSTIVNIFRGDELDYFTALWKGMCKQVKCLRYSNYELKSKYTNCSRHILGMAVIISAFLCSYSCV